MEKQSTHQHKEEEDGDVETKWSERIEDLVDAGETDQAISLLESLVSKLQLNETATANNRQLAAVLSDLAALYNSKHPSLKADTLLSRAALLTAATARNASENGVSVSGESTSGHREESIKSPDIVSSPQNADLDDDWEAVADRADVELLPTQSLTRELNHSSEDTKVQAPKRRGRGTFSYDKNKMYCDQQFQSTTVDAEDEDSSISLEGRKKSNKHKLLFPMLVFYFEVHKVLKCVLVHILTYFIEKCGTRHVLVLADFSPTLRTMDLEKLFADFTDREVSIRWINDITALAVFPNPSVALEARNQVRCPFTVRVLEDDDALLECIPVKDLEPPRQRPKTSARTAQRLIAHGMGLKLPSTFGSRESKEQEEARQNRIVTRQKLKDDAWGE